MKNYLKLFVATSLLILGSSCSKQDDTLPEENEVNQENLELKPVEIQNGAVKNVPTSDVLFEEFGEFKITHRYTPETGWLPTNDRGTSPQFVFETFLYSNFIWEITPETITFSTGSEDPASTSFPYTITNQGTISLDYSSGLNEDFTLDYEVYSYNDGNALLIGALNERFPEPEYYWFVKQ